MLQKIISGGQTGADLGGLCAGRDSGIETGGTAAPGWMTAKGPQQAILEGLGLVEGEPDSTIYRMRTIRNVQDSDATLWMGNPYSPGGKLTTGTAKRLGRVVLVNPTVEELAEFLTVYRVNTLNVAGNREHTNPGIGIKTRTLVNATLKVLVDQANEQYKHQQMKQA